MPLYDLKCTKCGEVSEVLIGLSEMPKSNDKILNLKELSISCSKCGNQEFTKLISAHGKTPINWAAWQVGHGGCSGCKKSCTPTKRLRKK